ncbi:MAG: response regulator [Oceanospirillaceae bacterium]|nr:response regulator [Oceanospirillaceae bacterium]
MLIGGDCQSNLLRLKELLVDQCNCVTCANSGNQALSLLLKNHNYSLILLDVQMPELDGLEI